jgi:hypothetical protein
MAAFPASIEPFTDEPFTDMSLTIFTKEPLHCRQTNPLVLEWPFLKELSQSLRQS